MGGSSLEVDLFDSDDFVKTVDWEAISPNDSIAPSAFVISLGSDALFDKIVVRSTAGGVRIGYLSYEFAPEPVRTPEPGAVALPGLSVAGLGIARRRIGR